MSPGTCHTRYPHLVPCTKAYLQQKEDAPAAAQHMAGLCCVQFSSHTRASRAQPCAPVTASRPVGS